MKTQLTVYRCTELRKAVQLDVGKFLLYVLFMKIRVNKVINPTIVPLRYYHVCPKYLRK